MKLGMVIRGACALGLFACSSSEREGDLGEAQRLLDALQRGMLFENGEGRGGEIPDADAAADMVNVSSSASALMLVPGSASIMPLGVDAPADASPPAVALLQFEGSNRHTAVPVEDAAADAGPAEPTTIENPFTIATDICADLCNRLYTTQMFFAVELEDGSVSVSQSIDLVLDCRETGDPDRCEPNEATGGADGGVREDAGDPGVVMLDAGTKPGSDAGAVPVGGEPPPQLSSISPTSADPGAEVMIKVMGTGFASGATVLVNGTPVPTTYLDDMALEASVPATLTANPGSLAITVENVSDDPSSRSNVLYLVLNAIPGAPVIFDYSPDNGVAGDTILIIASNLADQTLTIEDASGAPLEPGTLGTISWPSAGLVDTVEVVLPEGIATGPITVANELGSYVGKIFSVGLNLTRAQGTVVEASSEYNTTNWSKASGADNNLATSYFTANGDCATATTCTMVPWFKVTFASNQTVARIAMRGNREYMSGYDFIRGTFEVLGANDSVLWGGDYDLPEPDRDLDIVISPAVSGARAVRFTSLEDESIEPGFAELEVFGP